MAEILGNMIRQNIEIKGITLNEKEYALGQYADDTQLFLDGTESSLEAAIKTLNTFYKMSGLKLNIEKSQAIWIGSMAGQKLKLCESLDLDWQSGNFDILGITLNPNLQDLWVINTRKRMEIIKKFLPPGSIDN